VTFTRGSPELVQKTENSPSYSTLIMNLSPLTLLTMFGVLANDTLESLLIGTYQRLVTESYLVCLWLTHEIRGRFIQTLFPRVFHFHWSFILIMRFFSISR